MEGFIFENEEEKAISKRKEEARSFCNKELSKAWKILAASVGSLLLGGLGCYIYFSSDDFGSILFLFAYIGFALFGILGVISYPNEIKKIKSKIKNIEFDLVDVEAYVAKEKELQQKLQTMEDERKAQEAARKNEQYQYDHPECPICKSRNTSRISTLNRAISVGAVGLASSKIGKQYECYHCKHKW